MDIKDFSFLILCLYFGYKLFMGIKVIFQWNLPAFIEARKSLGNPSIKGFYAGIVENSILLMMLYTLYAK